MTSRSDLAPSSGSASAVASAPASDALVGKRVDKYEIVRVIGRGGMGTVYEALNTTIGKRVAMKFVDAETAQSKESIARFQREAEAASAVESAHIVEIFDSGVADDGIPYIVMELLRGEDLGHRIKRCGRLEIGEAVHIVAQILRGLHRAHEAGIVHRDLKPDNIFLVDRDDDQSFAKILDFGISKVQRQGGVPVHTLTRRGTVLGTPFYMSPEQAQALPDIDGRTDLWSVGAILYESLTGRPPYTGTSYEQVIVNICMHDAEDVRVHNPAVSEAIARVIGRALARDRGERFATAREVLEALKVATGGAISSNSGAIPAEERSAGDPSSPDFRLTPRLAPGITVAAPSSVPGVPSSPIEVRPASSKAWSTSRRAAARREKRTFAIIAVSALLAGSLGAFLYVRSRPQAAPPPAPREADEISVQLEANVAGARFVVDGAPVQSGVLKGQKGEVKRVRIEAEGYAPSELDVKLSADEEPVHIVLAAATIAASTTTLPVVSPGVDAAAARSAEPGKKPPRDPGKASAAAPIAPPTATPGVGGQLKLKKD
jgi:eukaryotic-like serine/threonine-protein kinase